MDRPSDDWLQVLESLQKGDRVALARVTSVITGFLARLGAYDLRDSWDDICQEVLLSLVRSARRGRITDSRSFVNYLGTITRNEFYDWLSKRRRAPPPGRSQAEATPGHDPGAAGQTDWLDESRLALGEALARLPEREREAVREVYLMGRTYPEAAQLLGTPLGTLKRVLRQGLAALRRDLVSASDPNRDEPGSFPPDTPVE